MVARSQQSVAVKICNIFYVLRQLYQVTAPRSYLFYVHRCHGSSGRCSYIEAV